MAKKKKKRVLKIKNIIILLFVLIVIVSLIYWLVTMPIRNIYISGNKIVLDDEIIQTSNLYNYPSFLLTQKKDIEKYLVDIDYIEDINIKKKFGNIIEIIINEYSVIALMDNNKIVLENGKILDNIYDITDVPMLVNVIDNQELLNNFSAKFGQIDENILRQISQIEYSPVDVDNERFLLYMNDGNLVYITLTRINMLNKYNKIKDKLIDRNGIIYLDSGNYVELKKDLVVS